MLRSSSLALLVALLVSGAENQASRPVEAAKTYRLGPDDLLLIRVLDFPEISASPFRIDMKGNINLPLAGRVHAGGCTVEELEIQIAQQLREYVKEPAVTVSVSEFGSQPVSVLGAVGNPGIHQIRGRKTLVEVLAEAGGLKNEAGNSLKITRRREWGTIPLSSVVLDSSGDFSLAEVSLKSLMEARNPHDNIEVQPYDVISVPRAELVYVVGAVKRSGGFPLNERESISVLQALSLAEGLDRTASAGSARILRSSESKSRTEIPIDVNKILSGKTRDVSLMPNDILFVPNSAAKSATLRAVEAAIEVGTGVVIWRR